MSIQRLPARAVAVNDNIVPEANVAYDLGTTTARFRDLYLSGNSLILGGATITASGNAVVLPVGTVIAGGGALGATGATGATGSTPAIGGSSTQVQYNNAGALAGSANLTFNGTSLTLGGNPTLTAGTANGVMYLNGSKVATSGSALTFDASANFNFTGTGLYPVIAVYPTGNNAIFGFRIDASAGNGIDWRMEQGRSAVGDFNLSAPTVNPTPQYVILKNLSAQYWSIGSSEGMRLTTTGLGIGLGGSSPASKLDVKGRVTLSGVGASEVYTSDASGMYLTAATSGGMYVASDNAFYFRKASSPYTEYMRIDSSGNLGLGVAPSSATFRTFQIGNGSNVGSLTEDTGYNDFNFGSNCYFDTTWKYRKTGEGASLFRAYGYDGQFIWQRAGSGTAGNTISWTTPMTLDASGRLLVGVTSSQGNGSRLQIGGGTQYFGSQGTNGLLSSTSYFNTNSSGFEIAKLDVSTGGNIYEGVFQFYTKDSGGTMAERVRITSGGAIGIGTTSPSETIFVQTPGTYGTNYIAFSDRTTLTSGDSDAGGIKWYDYAGAAASIGFKHNSYFGAAPRAITFNISGSERARITSGGKFNVGLGSGSIATDQGIELDTTQGYLSNNSTTGAGVSLILLRSSYSVADEVKFEVTSEGNVKSRTNSYAGFSDERLKQGIKPANTQWDDVKSIEVVNFQMKSEQISDNENPWMLGVIAQQVEKVSPGLVEEDVKDGMKSVKYSILYMKAVKALQEAMDRIETLEAKVAALEGTQP